MSLIPRGFFSCRIARENNKLPSSRTPYTFAISSTDIVKYIGHGGKTLVRPIMKNEVNGGKKLSTEAVKLLGSSKKPNIALVASAFPSRPGTRAATCRTVTGRNHDGAVIPRTNHAFVPAISPRPTTTPRGAAPARNKTGEPVDPGSHHQHF